MRTLVTGVCGFVAAMAAYGCRAEAQVAVVGSFTAAQACPAMQSFRKATNPGNVSVQVGMTYHVVAKNKANASHYQILIDEAEPQQRWVSADCGQLDTASSVDPRPTKAAAAASGARATHVLAMGWEPAFCTKHGDKAECKGMTSSSYPATHLSLHGLWPQPRGKFYCNVAPELVQQDKSHSWNSLPEPEIGVATRVRLAAVMPGVQSNLQRHEWIVHGTCYGGAADGYFARAAELAEAINASKVQKVFADNVGGSLSADAIRAAFDEAFGAGAGARVSLSCQGRGGERKISELTIGLAGDVTGSAALGDLIRAAQPTPAGCPGGVVDRAAF